MKPFARILRAIPISSELRPREMLQSLRTASEAIQNGEVVCIFAEGQITRIGQLLPFRRGFERIMKDVEAPIIPVALDGVWGSIFSFERGRFLWKLPRRIPYPRHGELRRAAAADGDRRSRCGSACRNCMAKRWAHRKAHMKPLQRAFVRTARRHPFRFAMADARTPRRDASARRSCGRSSWRGGCGRHWAGQEMVGLLLPPSVPGALVNFAALLMGKVPVNLNYTVSEETLASCIRQCGIKTVLTSRAFLEKVKLKVARRDAIFLEEVAARPGVSARSCRALLSACAAAGPRVARDGRWAPSGATQLDDLATVIFSSGSTGDPKGVMLSHYNIGSNVEQLEQVFGLHRARRLRGRPALLPFVRLHGHAVPAGGAGRAAWSTIPTRSTPRPSARWSASTP